MIDWQIARKGIDKGINHCFTHGMGTDLTDEQVKAIIHIQAKIGGSICMMAWHIPPSLDTFVTDYDWHVILHTSQEDEQP